VQRRHLAEQRLELIRVVFGDLARIQALDVHPLGQYLRRGERLLHRDLLVKQHTDQ
jgi:hypothetical protein